MIKKYVIPPIDRQRKVRYWCQDESRVGLKTEAGRLITNKGTKLNGTKITLNPVFIRLLDVGCGVWGVGNKLDIVLFDALKFNCLIPLHPTPYTLHPALTTFHLFLVTFGTKPIGIMQWKRDNFYLYGLVEPLTGEYFIWEFSHLNAACFNIFLEKFSANYTQDIHIIQLDNGAFHLSQHLQIPENIILLFQPPHTPQVNPIERLWEEVKRHLAWENFENLDELREFIWKRLEKLSTSIVASITGWDFILDALFISNFS